MPTLTTTKKRIVSFIVVCNSPPPSPQGCVCRGGRRHHTRNMHTHTPHAPTQPNQHRPQNQNAPSFTSSAVASQLSPITSNQSSRSSSLLPAPAAMIEYYWLGDVWHWSSLTEECGIKEGSASFGRRRRRRRRLPLWMWMQIESIGCVWSRESMRRIDWVGAWLERAWVH
jgi:hypothetical protein